MDVRFYGADAVGDGGRSPNDDADMDVDEQVFVHWLESSGFVLGAGVARWWAQAEVSEDAVDECEKHEPEETASGFYAKVRVALGGAVTLRLLTRHLLERKALELPPHSDEHAAHEDLVDRVLEEIVSASSMIADAAAGGVFETVGNAAADEADAERLAGQLAYGWPAVHDEPTPPCSFGRFVKSFPLKFPMGVGDLFDADRPRPVATRSACRRSCSR